MIEQERFWKWWDSVKEAWDKEHVDVLEHVAKLAWNARGFVPLAENVHVTVSKSSIEDKRWDVFDRALEIARAKANLSPGDDYRVCFYIEKIIL